MQTTGSWRRTNSGKKSSSWLITINTNKQPTPELEQGFDTVLQALFRDNNVKNFIMVHEGNPATISRIDVDVGDNEYSSNNLLHVHTVVSIPGHDCKLSLNYGAIRQVITSSLGHLGVTNPHLDVKLLNDHRRQAINYARKTSAQAE